MDRYKIGSGTLSLIMERYHAGGIPIEELQMMPPKEVELLFILRKILKRRIFHFQIFSTTMIGFMPQTELARVEKWEKDNADGYTKIYTI